MPPAALLHSASPRDRLANHAYFVIPVYNEEPNIVRVLHDLAVFQSEALKRVSRTTLVFVDDGSNDRTAELLAGAGQDALRVLRHPVNRGPGAAFQTAFRHLLDNGLEPDDLVITLEGDATSDPQVFPRMLRRLDEGDDIVLASPYLYGGGFTEVHGNRLIISHIGNALTKVLLNVRGLATFSCFFRIYRGRALRGIADVFPTIVGSDGFESAAEILMKAVRLGMPISEVPFRVDWSRRRGKSKMRVLRTSLGYFRLFLAADRESARRVEGRLETPIETALAHDASPALGGAAGPALVKPSPDGVR